MADDVRRRYGSMERIPFHVPSPPYTLHPSGGRVELIPAPPSRFHDLYGIEFIPPASPLHPSAPPPLHPAASSFHPSAPPLHPAASLIYPSAPPLHPAAPPRRHPDIDIVPAAQPRYPASPSLPAAGSRHGDQEGGRRSVDQGALRHGGLDRARRSRSMESLYAGAAHHFGVAARYMEEAERRRARASEDGGDSDPELGLDNGRGGDNGGGYNVNGGGDKVNNDSLCAGLLEAICGGDDGGGLLDCICGGDDDGDDVLVSLLRLLFGMCIGGDRDAAEDNKRFYKLIYPVLAVMVPYVLYTILPQHVVHGSDDLLRFVITTVTVVVSVRVLSSRCCTSICLRTLLFAITVFGEVMAYLHITPDSTVARVGAIFSLVHLVCLSIGLDALVSAPSPRLMHVTETQSCQGAIVAYTNCYG